MPNEPFLRTMKYLPFQTVFSKFVSLNRESRKLLFNSFECLHKERAISVDLSGSTKILKKVPQYVARRLNYIGVKMR